MSWMANLDSKGVTHRIGLNRTVYLKIIVQIIPRVILTFPSTISKDVIVIGNVSYF